MRLSFLEVAIFTLGLVAAAAASVFAYRTVGLYGDGAFAGGYHRERDPDTGKWLLLRDVVTANGLVRSVMDERKAVKEVRVDTDGDGVVETRVKVDAGNLAGVGFSLANDGVIDAWAYRDAANQLVRIEVSTKRNGKIDRWEHYTNNQMVRVEIDTNGNGRADRWQTYDAGILIDTVLDANEDGQPDGPPVR
jgi:hypothetical protein